MCRIPYSPFQVIFLATVWTVTPSTAPCSADAKTPLDIGNRKQLFIDNSIVASQHHAYRVLNQPVKHANPVLELVPDQEIGGDAPVMAGGAVMYDTENEQFKMWYQAVNYDWSKTYVGYAVSDDGIHWKLPNLGLIEHNGSKTNNIVFKNPAGEVAPAVFKDPVAKDPRRTFKMIYKRRGGVGSPGTGVGVAFSPDGIHWEIGPDRDVIPIADSPHSVLWDPLLKRYVAHTRHNHQFPERLERQVLQSESTDFIHWKRYGVIMKADEQDLIQDRQFYNMEWMRYEGLNIGFLAVYHTLPGMEVKTTRGLTWMDKVDIQLTISRDGHHWQRAGNRKVFLPTGTRPNDFDYGMIYVMQHPLLVGDEIWIYYTGYSGLHWATRRRERQGGVIGLARLRRDGFVSIDAGEGTVTTRPFEMNGNQLIVNADAALGSLKVAVLGANGKALDGFSIDESDTITGDNIRHVITWQGNRDLRHFKGKTIALQFHLDRTKLYSFVFRSQ